MATVSARHGGDDIIAGTTALFITSDDLPAYTSVGYDPDNYPASPAIQYYFSIEKSGEDSLVSQVFVPTASTGVGEWNDVIIPAAGSWTLHVRKVADDQSVANTSLTVV